MKPFNVLASASLALSLILAGCGSTAEQAATTDAGQKQEAPASAEAGKKEEAKTEVKAEKSPADYANATKELVEELEKGKDGGTVDWDKVKKIYDEKIKEWVQARDAEYSDQVNDQLESAITAGKDGALSPLVVAELHEKLYQKVTFFTLRHEFKEANDNFKDKEEAAEEVKEAKEFYDALLKPMIEKRDKAYETQLVSTIDAGFSEMSSAVEKGDNLAYNLGKQVVDKTLMKAFYLASGAEKGYGYKIEKLVKEGSKDDLKVPQAEGWAFSQSLQSYLVKHDKEAADFINSQFDLSNDVKNIQADKINQAFVRAFAATAKGEYGETFENWGKDKAVITALEGALFIDIMKNDLPKALGGEENAKKLQDLAGQLLDEVKAGNKDKATELHKQVEAELDKLQKYGK